MVKYLGSHDSPRFVSLSTYRDQSPQWPSGVTGNKWDNLAVAPPDQEPYDRLWLAELSLMTTPGIPLLYYGDEHGEFGSSDPDNRHMMRFSGLSSAEAAQDARMTALLTARSQLRGLGRGDMKTAYLTEDVYAYARPDAEAKGGALVVLNRLATQQMVAVPVPPELGWTSGAALRDYLGGTEYSLGGSTLMVTVPARGGLIIGMK